jgi:hypothetical protein
MLQSSIKKDIVEGVAELNKQRWSDNNIKSVTVVWMDPGVEIYTCTNRYWR